MESLFIAPDTFDPTVFDPTELTAGPWRADAQHGGPPAALLARMIETIEEPTERVARLSIELVKPVPLAQLTTTVDRTQVSRRVAHASASLTCNGVVVATASALLLATAELPEPGWRPEQITRSPDDAISVVAPTWASGDTTAFHRDAVDHRFIEGEFSVPGSAVEWIRLRQPIVAGEEPSPLSRVAAAADIASGISAVYGSESGVGLINADLTISLHRPLVGDWVGVDAVTEVGADGIGLCTNRLFDTHGTIGTATQSLIGWRTS